MKKTKPVCPSCGSDDVTLDAISKWDIDLQQWDLIGELDNGDCNACGEDTKSFEWIDVESEPVKQPVCPHCKSTNISMDSVSVWNTDTNQWENEDVYGTGGCQDCDKEFEQPDWIEVKEDDGNNDDSTTQSPDRTGKTVQQEPADPADQG